MSPPNSRDPGNLLRRLGQLWLTYIKGQLLLSLIVGGIIWVVGSAIGLAWAGWLGLAAGLLETIPSLGPLVALIPAIVAALWKGSTVIPVSNWVFALIVVAVYLSIQQISALAIEPHIMGKRLNLPPLMVLVTVIAGAALGGILGAYLAVPVLASIREILSFYSPRSDHPHTRTPG